MTHTSLYLVLHSIYLVTPLLFPHLSRLPHLNILFLHYMPTFSGDQLSLVSCFGVSEDPVWCHLGLQGDHIAHQSLPKEEQKLNTLICNRIPLVLLNLLNAQSMPYNESTDEYYSRCSDSLQIMWTSDHIAPEKTGSLLFWSGKKASSHHHWGYAEHIWHP